MHSVVLSFDAKRGPINTAYAQGGKIVFLTDFEISGLSLREFIRAALAPIASGSARTPRQAASARPETYDEIKPDADDLLVFIDDTGHETFAGNQGFYGLGGCLTTGSGYEHLKPKSREVRKSSSVTPRPHCMVLTLPRTQSRKASSRFAAFSKTVPLPASR